MRWPTAVPVIVFDRTEKAEKTNVMGHVRADRQLMARRTLDAPALAL